MIVIRVCLIALSLGSLWVLGRVPAPVASTPRSSPNAGVVLYDGARNTGTPDTQGQFRYGTDSAQATQSFSNGVTTLDTTANIPARAGYGYAGAIGGVTFDRAAGYTVRFTVQLASEQHANNDRAGFSIIALSSDNNGIELGFWKDQIWAQNTNFTHGEGESFNTTAALTTYDLTIYGGAYTLRSGGTVILTGSLRDYSSFCKQPSADCPYGVPNFLFLGDNTSSAQANILFSFASLTTGTPERPTPTAATTPTPQSINLFLPILMKAPFD